MQPTHQPKLPGITLPGGRKSRGTWFHPEMERSRSGKAVEMENRLVAVGGWEGGGRGRKRHTRDVCGSRTAQYPWWWILGPARAKAEGNSTLALTHKVEGERGIRVDHGWCFHVPL